MKILYVTTMGGTMNFFISLIQTLIKSGNIVDIATNETIAPVPPIYKQIGCTIYHIPTSRSPFSVGNISAMKIIKKIATQYDIIHCHTPLAGIATRFACKKLRKKSGLKVIYTAHGFHFYKGSPIKNWLLYYPIEKLCSSWTDCIVTINKEDYYLAKNKMKSADVEYVSGVGIDIKKYVNTDVDKEKKRNEIGVPSEAKIILSVGELNKNKNQQVIIKALKLLNNNSFFYVVAGEGPQRSELNELAKKMHVNLILLGKRDDVNELYKISDVFAFPSLREGLGLAAIEALASGLPVVCIDNRGTREYTCSKLYSCENNDPKEFAHYINDLLLCKQQHQLDDNSFSAVQRFDYLKVNNQMIEIYKKVRDEK